MQAVDVVFVNYRSEEDLLRAIREFADGSSHGLRLDVKVVDCSGISVEDETRLRRQNVPVVIVRPAMNVGFGPGANCGAASGVAAVVAFVNPDVELDVANFASLVRRGSEDRAVAWSGVLRNADGSVQRNAGPAPTLLQLAAEYLAGIDTRWRPLPVPRDVAVLTGAVLLVDRDAFEDVGGFAPDLPLYMEDVDLCRRLASCGRVVQYPIDVGVHMGGRSARHAPAATWTLLHASRVAFFARRGRLEGLVARGVVMAGVVMRAVLRDRATLRWLPSLFRATAAGFPLERLLPPVTPQP